jgi:hypothetical protein
METCVLLTLAFVVVCSICTRADMENAMSLMAFAVRLREKMLCGLHVAAMSLFMLRRKQFFVFTAKHFFRNIFKQISNNSSTFFCFR